MAPTAGSPQTKGNRIRPKTIIILATQAVRVKNDAMKGSTFLEVASSSKGSPDMAGGL